MSPEQIQTVADVRAVRSDVPESVAHAIARAMAKNRNERWESAAAMAAALERAAAPR